MCIRDRLGDVLGVALAQAVETGVAATKEAKAAKAEVPVTKADKFDMLKAVAKTLDKQFSTTFSIVRLGSKVGVPIPSIQTKDVYKRQSERCSLWQSGIASY